MGYWDVMMKQTLYIADYASRSVSGDKTYGAARAVKARDEGDVWSKGFFDGKQRDLFTKIAINEELANDWQGIVWLRGEDQGDASKGRCPYIVRPVYDENNNFQFTVLEF